MLSHECFNWLMGFRSTARDRSESAFIARISLLDGAGDCEADELYVQCRYLECGLSRRRDVDGDTPLV